MSGTGEALPASGPLAPPMANGEVVFEAPWQGRVFGMARAMAEAELFAWDEFRRYLIAELPGQPSPDRPFAYYDHFLRALENLVADKGLVPGQVLGDRLQVLKARPHGHDHKHVHKHDHGPNRARDHP